MGPPQATDLLMECLAMGADEGILISDRAVGGSDTWGPLQILLRLLSERSVIMI